MMVEVRKKIVAVKLIDLSFPHNANIEKSDGGKQEVELISMGLFQGSPTVANSI